MITLFAPAKINLYLHVTGRRPDGYHLLDSLVVFLHDMADRVILEPADTLQIDVVGLVPKGADGEDNLAARTVKAVARHVGREPNIRIRLEKNIPSGAGLGGGSSDAAAVVKGLERLWDLSLAQEERDTILLSLGADVPLCYHARPCRFGGIGEILSDVPALPRFSILLIWPDAHSATRDIFAARTPTYTAERAVMPSHFDDLASLLAFLAQTENDLQAVAESLTPAIAAARFFLETREGCLLARMTGSGSCVFGIFEDRGHCEAAQAAAHEKFPVWWTHAGIV
ncbi:MAG TPA: 4-(cytidine 5'-diphospho)-2-C-methyl-D-erythritol kinase [Micavibrio sp.]|nr:4-(cytidine 5'-diphospho)-2-C-methyl-D-erythritol kinase [Micavibrio sp.]